MDLEQIKYSTCPFDQEEGVLLTDIEEMSPQTDEDGDLQYYCVAGNHMYVLDEDEDKSNPREFNADAGRDFAFTLLATQLLTLRDPGTPSTAALYKT